MTRVRSTRRLEVAARENPPFIWLLGGQHPDHSTLARFFKANREAMRALFKRTVHTAVQVGLVGFALHAIDGTRVSAVSRDKTLTREELLALEEAIANLDRSVGAEDKSGVAESEALTMPAELRNPEELRGRIQTALTEIDERKASKSAIASSGATFRRYSCNSLLARDSLVGAGARGITRPLRHEPTGL